MKTLVIGYAPVAGSVGESHGVAFLGTDSGRRLARYLGVEPHELLDHVDAVNLHREPDAEWVVSRASRRARALWDGFVVPLGYRRVLLASAPVAQAFGRSYHPLLEWGRVGLDCSADTNGDGDCGRVACPTCGRQPVQVAVIPHPSGLVRWWNDPENVARARDFLVSAVQLQER